MHPIIKEYKEILKGISINGPIVAGKLGLKYSSYKIATMKSQSKPSKWIEAFIYGFKLGRNNKLTKQDILDVFAEKDFNENNCPFFKEEEIEDIAESILNIKRK